MTRFEELFYGIALAIKPRLDDFYKRNGKVIKEVFEGARKIDLKYNDEVESNQLTLKDGVSKEDYDAEINAYMDEEVRLII